MANVDIIKPSFDALHSMSETVRAFVDFADLLPEDDSFSSLLRILGDRLESDMFLLRKEVGDLWKLVPDDLSSS